MKKRHIFNFFFQFKNHSVLFNFPLIKRNNIPFQKNNLFIWLWYDADDDDVYCRNSCFSVRLTLMLIMQEWRDFKFSHSCFIINIICFLSLLRMCVCMSVSCIYVKRTDLNTKLFKTLKIFLFHQSHVLSLLGEIELLMSLSIMTFQIQK